MNIFDKAFIRGENIKDTLKHLEKHIDVLLEDKEDYRKRCIELQEEHYKDEELKRLKEELEFCRRNSLVILSDKEKHLAKNFSEVHYSSCKNQWVNYIVTPTGIGLVVKIECPVCGEVLDITNYDKW